MGKEDVMPIRNRASGTLRERNWQFSNWGYLGLLKLGIFS